MSAGTKQLLLVILGGVFLACTSSSDVYCERLITLASSPDIAERLEMWAKEHVFEPGVSMDEVDLEPNRYPGFYALRAPFDWDLLGFDPKWAMIKILGPRGITMDIRDNRLQIVKAVVFSEESRTGIIVKAPGLSDFGIKGRREKYLKPISENIAVMCSFSE